MESNRLLNLPRELQVKIFQYLSSSDLVIFEEFGAGTRFYDLSYEKAVVRKTDMCCWRHVSANTVKSYLQKRAKNIRELCLNNLTYVKSPNFLTQISLTTKFRELKSLHIVNCRVSLEHLRSILMELRHLEKLSWSLMVTKTLYVFDDFVFERLKVFYVESYLHGDMRHKQAMMHVLKWFRNLECLRIHFSVTVHTMANRTSYKCATANFDKLHSLVCTAETFHMFHSVPFYDDSPIGTHTRSMIQTIIEQRGSEKPWKRLWLLNSSQGIELYEHIETKETSVIGARHMNIEYVEPQPVMEMAGPSVKIVQLNTCHVESNINLEEFLRDFFSQCSNITELNLFNTHFDPLAFPCRAIASLKKLKKLLIPLCCIFTTEFEIQLPTCHRTKGPRTSRIRHSTADVNVPLSDIVKGCPEMTDLDIRQFENTLCSICRGSTKGKHPEEDLVPLHAMKKLSSLTLVGIQANRMPQGKFLECIGRKRQNSRDFCQKLAMLRLYFIGPQGHHSNLGALSTAFCNLTYLRDISLQHSSLNLESKSFWNVFSRVSGLERLCIASNFTDSLPIKVMESFILQVPRLYVFHVHSRANNFTKAKSTLTKFVDELRPARDCHPTMEIVIQHLTMHIGLTTTERIRHDGRVCHIQELCVPGTNIGQMPQNCGMASVL